MQADQAQTLDLVPGDRMVIHQRRGRCQHRVLPMQDLRAPVINQNLLADRHDQIAVGARKADNLDITRFGQAGAAQLDQSVVHGFDHVTRKQVFDRQLARFGADQRPRDQPAGTRGVADKRHGQGGDNDVLQHDANLTKKTIVSVSWSIMAEL